MFKTLVYAVVLSISFSLYAAENQESSEACQYKPEISLVPLAYVCKKKTFNVDEAQDLYDVLMGKISNLSDNGAVFSIDFAKKKLKYHAWSQLSGQALAGIVNESIEIEQPDCVVYYDLNEWSKCPIILNKGDFGCYFIMNVLGKRVICMMPEKVGIEENRVWEFLMRPKKPEKIKYFEPNVDAISNPFNEESNFYRKIVLTKVSPSVNRANPSVIYEFDARTGDLKNMFSFDVLSSTVSTLRPTFGDKEIFPGEEIRITGNELHLCGPDVLRGLSLGNMYIHKNIKDEMYVFKQQERVIPEIAKEYKIKTQSTNSYPSIRMGPFVRHQIEQIELRSLDQPAIITPATIQSRIPRIIDSKRASYLICNNYTRGGFLLVGAAICVWIATKVSFKPLVQTVQSSDSSGRTTAIIVDQITESVAGFIKK